MKNEVMSKLSEVVRKNRESLGIRLPSIQESPVEDMFWYVLEDEIIPLSDTAFSAHKNDESIILNWILPPMGAGSGGHLSIFRFISGLEVRGFHSKVYLYGEKVFHTDEELNDFIKKHYGQLHPLVECYSSTKDIQFAHFTIATGWQTAYFLHRFNNTLEKIYFVQDFEPLFYPHGSMYSLSEDTYRFGFTAITAGDWLKDLLEEKYGMTSFSFSFAANEEIYFPRSNKDLTQRIFFYARPATPRRDFELGMLALNAVCKKLPNVVVEFAGGNLDDYVIPFKHNCHGIMSLDELAELYSKCTISLILSATNLSLAPVEAMACGSVVACSDGPNSTWLVSSENGIIVSENPAEIAKTLEECLRDEELLSEKRSKAISFASTTSWEKEFDKVARVLRERLRDTVRPR